MILGLFNKIPIMLHLAADQSFATVTDHFALWIICTHWWFQAIHLFVFSIINSESKKGMSPSWGMPFRPAWLASRHLSYQSSSESSQDEFSTTPKVRRGMQSVWLFMRTASCLKSKSICRFLLLQPRWFCIPQDHNIKSFHTYSRVPWPAFQLYCRQELSSRAWGNCRMLDSQF